MRSLRIWGTVFFLIGLYVFLPFWVSRLAHGFEPWWRVPAILAPIFDAQMYLAWIGYIHADIPFGSNLGWMKPYFFLTHALFPSLSAAENWLLSQWLTVFVAIYLLWHSLFLLTRRLHTATFVTLLAVATTFLHTSQRPGIYSWYAPFGIASIALGWFVTQRIGQGHGLRIRDIGLLSLATLLSATYPWLLIPTLIWNGSLVVWAAAKYRGRRASFCLFIGVCIVIPAIIWLIFLRVEPTALAPILDTFKRYGLGWTRFPFFSTALLPVIGWIILTGYIAKRKTDFSHIYPLFLGWITVWFCFEFTPFTGVLFQNDHFRSTVLFLSWFSLAAMWDIPWKSFRFTDRSTRIPFLILLIALAFLFKNCYLLLSIPNQDLSYIHIAYWLPLALASIRFFYTPLFLERVSIIIALFIGLMGGWSVWKREWLASPMLQSLQPLIGAVEATVPASEPICTDIMWADRLAANIPRLIIPSITVRFLPQTEDKQEETLASFANFYRPAHQAEQRWIDDVIWRDGSLPCIQLRWTRPFLHSLGFSESSINKLIDCPQESFMQERERITLRSLSPQNKKTSVCPWVIVRDEASSSWHLPHGTKIYGGSGFTLWKQSPITYDSSP